MDIRALDQLVKILSLRRVRERRVDAKAVIIDGQLQGVIRDARKQLVMVGMVIPEYASTKVCMIECIAINDLVVVRGARDDGIVIEYGSIAGDAQIIAHVNDIRRRESRFSLIHRFRLLWLSRCCRRADIYSRSMHRRS